MWSGGLANSVHYDSLERRPAKQLAKSHFPLAHRPGQARRVRRGNRVLVISNENEFLALDAWLNCFHLSCSCSCSTSPQYDVDF